MAPDLPQEASLETATSRQVLAGHVGHLTSSQEAALVTLKERLAETGYYTPSLEGREASSSDVDLVRFLRARKFDVQGAFDQFTSAADWRRTQNIDQLYDTFSLTEFEQARQLYPQWTGRRDNFGLPVYLYKVGALSKEKTDAYVKTTPERLEQRMVALYEHMVQFVVPFCSAVPHGHQETPISGCATIVDISNVSLRRFWQLKDHMQRASTLATARYAETLGAIYLVGAPGFFSTVWGWIKKYPGTVEKIHILPSSPSAILSILCQHLPLSSIPRAYGGQLDWDFDAPGPLLDQAAREVLGREEVPVGPVRWDERRGRIRAVGEGRVEEEEAGTSGAAQVATGSEGQVRGRVGGKEEVFVTPPATPGEVPAAEAQLAQRLEETKL
ncbi:hypothetical protein JCM11641_000817 [Rhodosporidiobolus odoratus]